jgi:predicted RNA polymerase sigma factor
MGETVQAILVAPTSAAVVGLPAMADVMERARKAFEDAGIPFEVGEVREGEHRLIFFPIPPSR